MCGKSYFVRLLCGGWESLTVVSLPLQTHYKDIAVASLPLLSGNKVLPSTSTLTTLTVVKEKAVRKQAHINTKRIRKKCTESYCTVH
jgi:hypothetical protein